METKEQKALSKFKKCLKKDGKFLTYERKVIFDYVFNKQNHFEAEQLVGKLKTGVSRVSRATVYKTLKILEKSGFIREMQENPRHLHYEYVYGKVRHDHLLCESCGKVIEFKDKSIENLQKKICKKYNFIAKECSLQLIGLCRNCRSLRN